MVNISSYHLALSGPKVCDLEFASRANISVSVFSKRPDYIPQEICDGLFVLWHLISLYIAIQIYRVSHGQNKSIQIFDADSLNYCGFRSTRLSSAFLKYKGNCLCTKYNEFTQTGNMSGFQTNYRSR